MKSSGQFRIQFWFQLIALIVGLVIVVLSIRYMNSGDFQKSPSVQALMNPEATPQRSARIVVGTEVLTGAPSASPSPALSATPTKDR